MKNLVYRCKLPLSKQRKLAECFAMGATARAAAPIAKVARGTATLFFRKIRAKIHAERNPPGKMTGTVEVDECHFRGARGGQKARKQAGVRGVSPIGIFTVIGAVERETRRVVVEEIRNKEMPVLFEFIGKHVSTDCRALHTDSFKGYNPAQSCGYTHLRCNHTKRQYKNPKNGACTNTIESVWGRFKRHLRRFCGGWRHYFRLWLSELEFRAMNRTETLFENLMKLLKTKTARERLKVPARRCIL